MPRLLAAVEQEDNEFARHAIWLLRTVGSWLVQGGESLHLVGQVLNHRDTKTTAGYAYFQTQHRAKALTEHGKNILAFAPVKMNRAPLGDDPKLAAQTEDVLPDITLNSVNRARYFTREFLHRLVWESPVSEVARRLGISDVGLSKACRRALIPVPSRGYWAKLEAGKWIAPAPLPAPPPGLPGKVRIKVRIAAAGPQQTKEKLAKAAA